MYFHLTLSKKKKKKTNRAKTKKKKAGKKIFVINVFSIFFNPVTEQEVASQKEAPFPFQYDRHLSQFVSSLRMRFEFILSAPL